MSPDHPERVAAWLGEVFGGAKAYSEGYGGYERMVSQHLGKAGREEQRARWVELLSKSADDAMLPADPEWRAAFVAYLEWGSRIGLENSQPEAHPPPHMPVPRLVGLRRDAEQAGLRPGRRGARESGRPSRPRRACQFRAARQAAVPRA